MSKECVRAEPSCNCNDDKNTEKQKIWALEAGGSD